MQISDPAVDFKIVVDHYNFRFFVFPLIIGQPVLYGDFLCLKESILSSLFWEYYVALSSIADQWLRFWGVMWSKYSLFYCRYDIERNYERGVKDEHDF